MIVNLPHLLKSYDYMIFLLYRASKIWSLGKKNLKPRDALKTLKPSLSLCSATNVIKHLNVKLRQNSLSNGANLTMTSSTLKLLLRKTTMLMLRSWQLQKLLLLNHKKKKCENFLISFLLFFLQKSKILKQT